MKLNLTLEYEVPATGTTKWDVLQARLAALNEAASRISRELEGLERTTFGGQCSGCDGDLPTEAAFAKHFTIKPSNLMWGYLNLGDCPNDKETP